MKPGGYKKNPDSLRQKIEDLLKESGGMTIGDLVEELPQYTKGGISATICLLRDQGCIYVKEWEMTSPGEKRHPRPVWDHATNSKRQPPQNKQRPLPVTNAVRLKRRRMARSQYASQTRYMFKLVKASQESASE